VKVLDFGLAKPVNGKELAELTASGAIVGTPAYMAPEQGMGKAVDGRADLFSLGCVLYRLVTGKLPFERPTLMAILTPIATEEPPPVRELNPAVPEPLADLIHRLMAKKPDQRPQSAKDVADELALIATPPRPAVSPDAPTVAPQPVYVPIAVSVQQPNPFANLTEPSDDEPAESREVAAPPKKPRKFPALLVGGGLFGVLLLAVAGFIIIKITNKDGTVTEVKVPDDAKIEVDGKTVKPEPKKPTVKPTLPTSPDTPPVKASPPTTAAGLPAGKSGLRFATGDLATATNVPVRPTTVVTVEAWINFEDLQEFGGRDLIFSPNGSIKTSDTRFNFYTFHGAADAKDVIPKGRRVHVAAVNDGKKRYLYLDGKRIAESADAGAPIPENEQQAAGDKLTRIALGSELFTGTIDGVRVSTTAKYEKEFTPPEVFAKDKDTFALYLFDEGKGDTLNDSSGNGYHAKISGAKWVKGDGAAADDRKTAEWVLSIGGQVEVLAGGKRSTHRATNPLPSGPLELALVNIAFDQATDENAGRVSGLKRLTHLTFYGGPLSDRGVGQLRDLPQLLNLNLHGTAVTDGCLPVLKQFPQLSELVLMNTKVTPAGLAKLKDIANLTQLFLDETAVDDAGLEHLSQFTGLTRLSLKKTKVTEAGAKKLGGQLPSCLIEYEGGVIQPKSAPADADRKTAEWVLSHGGQCTVRVDGTDKLFRANSTLPPGPLELVGVEIIHEHATDENAGRVAGLAKLQLLTLLEGTVTNEGVAKLRDLPRLDYLNLHGTKVTDAGLPALKQLPELRKLILINTKVSDGGLAALKELPKLQCVVLDGTAVTDDGLLHLRAIPGLTEVKVMRTKVTEAGVKKLAAALPTCRIEYDGGTLGPAK
jgi:hypothetical protein